MSDRDADTGESWTHADSCGAWGGSGRTSGGWEEPLRSHYGCPTSQEARRTSSSTEAYNRGSWDFEPLASTNGPCSGVLLGAQRGARGLRYSICFIVFSWWYYGHEGPYFSLLCTFYVNKLLLSCIIYIYIYIRVLWFQWCYKLSLCDVFNVHVIHFFYKILSMHKIPIQNIIC